ncbi:retinol dehydrogenase 7-like [Gastrophryne carolinensis]
MWLLLLVVLGLIFLYRWHRQSQMLEDLTDKYVFITGCDSGFGNLLAKQLDKRGMKVMAACLTEKGAENLKKEVSSRLQTVILDVTDSRSVNSAAEWVSQIVGDKGLWGLVNNAGITGLFVPDSWAKKEDFIKVLNVNLLGTVDVTLTLLPLIRRARGRIVNVASGAGRLAIIPGGYSVSKFGVEAFSDTLRRELLDFGVKVSIIEPGAFQTPMANTSFISKSMEERWESLPPETKNAYGEQFLRQSIKDINRLVAIASPKLYKVTNSIEHGLTARYPWTRYAPGWDATFFYILFSYLPTFMSDYLIRLNAVKPLQRA